MFDYQEIGEYGQILGKLVETMVALHGFYSCNHYILPIWPPPIHAISQSPHAWSSLINFVVRSAHLNEIQPFLSLYCNLYSP